VAARGALILSLLSLAFVPQVSAQVADTPAPLEILAGPRRTPVFESATLADSVARPSQWKKGAVIGGASLGGAGLLLGLAYLAGGSEGTSVGDVALATLVCVAVGALVGGLIGGLIHS
jgi:hypothetical protein